MWPGEILGVLVRDEALLTREDRTKKKKEVPEGMRCIPSSMTILILRGTDLALGRADPYSGHGESPDKISEKQRMGFAKLFCGVGWNKVFKKLFYT